MCLSQLSVEDVDGLYMFGILIMGFLTLWTGECLINLVVLKQLTTQDTLLELCERDMMNIKLKKLSAQMEGKLHQIVQDFFFTIKAASQTVRPLELCPCLCVFVRTHS